MGFCLLDLSEVALVKSSSLGDNVDVCRIEYNGRLSSVKYTDRLKKVMMNKMLI